MEPTFDQTAFRSCTTTLALQKTGAGSEQGVGCTQNPVLNRLTNGPMIRVETLYPTGRTSRGKEGDSQGGGRDLPSFPLGGR